MKPMFIAALLGSLCPLGARADFHAVILANLANDPTPVAHFDFSSDQVPAMRVVVVGDPQVRKPIVLNANFFASSGNLFNFSALPVFMAYAISVDDATVPSQATLRLGGQRVQVPPLQQVQGTVFRFPLNDLEDGATLLIGNPDTNPTDAPVTVLFSPDSAVGTATVPLNGAIAVPLPVAKTIVQVASPTQIPLIVQLAIVRKGGGVSMQMLMPVAP